MDNNNYYYTYFNHIMPLNNLEARKYLMGDNKHDKLAN